MELKTLNSTTKNISSGKKFAQLKMKWIRAMDVEKLSG